MAIHCNNFYLDNELEKLVENHVNTFLKPVGNDVNTFSKTGRISRKFKKKSW